MPAESLLYPTTGPYGPACLWYGMLPYHSEDPKTLEVRSFGDRLEPRWIVGTEPLDQ